MSLCHFNAVLASTDTIVYGWLDCRVLAGRYACRALTNSDSALLNNEDFCEQSMVMANSLECRCQSGCQIVVRVVVRGLLSERLLSEWLLSEWLLSEWLQSESQSGWSEVKVRNLISAFLGIRHLSSLKHSKCQLWDDPTATQNPAGQTQKPKQRPKLWTQKRDPKPKHQPRRKKIADPKVESIERSQITWHVLFHGYIDQSQQTGLPVGKSSRILYHIVDQHRDQLPRWEPSGKPPVHIALVIASSAGSFQSTNGSWYGLPIELCVVFVVDQSARHMTMPDVPLSTVYRVLPWWNFGNYNIGSRPHCLSDRTRQGPSPTRSW